jgi:hypothetical protein
MKISNNLKHKSLLEIENMHLEVARIAYKLFFETQYENYKIFGEFFMQQAVFFRERNIATN